MTAFPLPALLLLPALLAAAAPAHAWQAPPACQLMEVATLPVRYTGPGLSLTIEGTIDGTPADMLVDTGAHTSMLTRTATEKRGLTLWQSQERVVGVGGYARMYTARIKQFQAGPAAIANQRVRVLGDFGTSPSFEAILGAPFLLQTDLEISLAEKQIKFFKPANCKSAMLAYWDPDAIEIPFLANFSQSRNPRFKVLLNGKEVTAFIDSGAAVTMLTRSAAEKAGLKMDTPGVDRVGQVVGVGNERVAHWSTTLETLQIGRETIRNAEVGVIDANDLPVDVLLGADFLRSHRVLFAMSQKKLYFSYVGGEPLGQRRRIEPWLQQEADAGNGDAQMMVASMHGRGHGVPRDPVKAQAWIEKAAAGGHPRAGLLVAQREIGQGQFAEAAARIRKVLDRQPGERFGALLLYRARMRNGEPELARQELAAAFTHDTDDWPGPVADYYLGKLDEAKLYKLARDERAHARSRTCQVHTYIAEGHRLAGDEARAKQVMEQAAECRAAPAKAP